MIYADYNGSSPLLPCVKDYLKKRIDSDLFANPNAIHSIGQKISQGIEKCREVIAQSVWAYPDQVIFNSGASEGISAILHSVLDFTPQSKKVVITSPIEHVVIHNGLKYFQEHLGFQIEHVQVDSEGKIIFSDLERLFAQFKNELALVTIMAANNETGVIQPYQEIAKLCQKFGVDYFCDTTQLIGKGEFNFKESGIDFAVCSGHKVGSLTGIGFIIAKEPVKLKPLVFGSYQEKGLRGGTQHYIGIETLALAMNDFIQNKNKLGDLKIARLEFEADLKKTFKEIVIVGEKHDRLAGTSLIGFSGLHGQAIQIELESHDIFVTTSAACSDNQPETSKVLKAMGIHDEIGRSVIRISLSYSHGKSDYAQLAHALKAAYNKLSRIHSF